MKILFLYLLLLTGCASAIKKQCQSTNWFTYGESVANQGRRTRDDDFVKACEKEKVEIDFAALSRGFQKGYAEYCTPEAAFRIGKQGEYFKFEFCDGVSTEQLIKKQHATGVRQYCQPSNGVPVGVTGKKYNGICPKDLEAKFVEKFNIGRKKYLNVLIATNEKSIDGLNREISDLQTKRHYESIQVTRLMQTRPPDQIYGRDPSTGQAILQPNTTAIDAYNNELRRQQGEVGRIDSDMGSKRGQQELLRKEIRDAQLELGALE